MKIKSIERASIPEIIIINHDIYKDDRGNFFETFNKKDFADLNLPTEFVQDNQAYSKKNTLRGFHYQLDFPQGKLVRVIKGKVFDVGVDIRSNSPTFGQAVGIELSDTNNKILYIPEGFAHAYLVLSDEAIFQYKCTDLYDPNDEYGIIWNDNNIAVDWPVRNPILSYKDKNLPALNQINEKYLPKSK